MILESIFWAVVIVIAIVMLVSPFIDPNPKNTDCESQDGTAPTRDELICYRLLESGCCDLEGGGLTYQRYKEIGQWVDRRAAPLP